jgi:hypothetical protein
MDFIYDVNTILPIHLIDVDRPSRRHYHAALGKLLEIAGELYRADAHYHRVLESADERCSDG